MSAGLIYVRVDPSVDHTEAYVFAPVTARDAIKAAIDKADRTWDTARRCWVIPAYLIPELRDQLDPRRFHVRLSATEPISTRPLFRKLAAHSTEGATA